MLVILWSDHPIDPKEGSSILIELKHTNKKIEAIWCRSFNPIVKWRSQSHMSQIWKRYWWVMKCLIKNLYSWNLTQVEYKQPQCQTLSSQGELMKLKDKRSNIRQVKRSHIPYYTLHVNVMDELANMNVHNSCISSTFGHAGAYLPLYACDHLGLGSLFGLLQVFLFN